MKDIVVFGTGPIAELADFYFREDTGQRVAGFTLDAAFCQGAQFLGRDLVPFEALATRFPPTQCDIFVAVGYAGLNKLRRARVDAAAAKGYGIAHYISSKATTFATLQPQENQFVLEGAIVQPFVRLGRNVTVWSGSTIAHHTEIGEDCFIAPNVAISGSVRIGAGCFIGIGATIRDSVSIGADCIVGAGALVKHDLPAGSVVSPAATPISPKPSTAIGRI